LFRLRTTGLSGTLLVALLITDDRLSMCNVRASTTFSRAYWSNPGRHVCQLRLITSDEGLFFGRTD
jgi:hypothetical protein